MLQQVDWLLLDRVFQPFSDWTASKFGVGHLKLARWMLHSTAVLECANIAAFYKYLSPTFTVVFMFLCLPMLFGLARAIQRTGKRDGIVMTLSTTLPEERVKYARQRINLLVSAIFIFCFSILNMSNSHPQAGTYLLILLLNAVSLTSILGYYFVSCRGNPSGSPKNVRNPFLSMQIG
jgi:hypothetical protein